MGGGWDLWPTGHSQLISLIMGLPTVPQCVTGGVGGGGGGGGGGFIFQPPPLPHLAPISRNPIVQVAFVSGHPHIPRLNIIFVGLVAISNPPPSLNELLEGEAMGWGLEVASALPWPRVLLVPRLLFCPETRYSCVNMHSIQPSGLPSTGSGMDSTVFATSSLFEQGFIISWTPGPKPCPDHEHHGKLYPGLRGRGWYRRVH